MQGKMCLVIQKMEHLRAFVDTVVNMWVPQNAENILLPLKLLTVLLRRSQYCQYRFFQWGEKRPKSEVDHSPPLRLRLRTSRAVPLARI